MHITLTNPVVLAWLPLSWLLAAVCWWTAIRSQRAMRERYGERELVDAYTRRESARAVALQLTGWLAVVTLLMVAIAHPVTKDEPHSVAAGSVCVVAVLDVSKSMAAEDYRDTMPVENGDRQMALIGPHGSRLAMAKYAIEHQIMPAVRENRLGLVTFTKEFWPQSPCTTDFISLKWVMDHWVGLGSAPGGGSDFVAGLRGALDTIKHDPNSSTLQNVVILFSDGGWTDDRTGLSQAIDQLTKLKVKLLVVGMGDTTPMQIPVYAPNGERSGWYQVHGETAKTALEADSLKELAAKGGGRYVHMDPSTTLPIDWVKEIAGSRVERGDLDLSRYPALAALLLITLICLRGMVRRRDVTSAAAV
jgi:Mg-chelatase subunit ChlD